MPGVSDQMKNSIGVTLTKISTVTIPKINIAIKKVTDLTGGDSADTANLATLKEQLETLAERHKNLAVGGLDDKRYQTLRADIQKAQLAATKMLGRVQREYTSATANAWKAAVVKPNGDAVDLSHYTTTMQGVFKKIVQSHGGYDHGDVKLASGGTCKHWVSGSERIFGKWASNKFTLLGTGRHTGTDNSKYKVDLVAGGSTTATVVK
jgi:hypothetical protein